MGHSKHSINISYNIIIIVRYYTKTNVFTRPICLRDSNAWSMNLRNPESKIPF